MAKYGMVEVNIACNVFDSGQNQLHSVMVGKVIVSNDVKLPAVKVLQSVVEKLQLIDLLK